MKKVALVYNPASGQRPERRARVLAALCEQLRLAGLEVAAWPTTAPGSASVLARQAVEQGYEVVLACGGDGTAHEVVQGLAGSEVALGVIPMGTANLLSVNLGFGNVPLKAAERLLRAEAVRIPLGRISYQDESGAGKSRYFLTVAGVGPDAIFLAGSTGKSKRRFGYLRYIVEAFRVWWMHAYPLYEARLSLPGEAAPRTERFSQLLAVRIRQFGPALHNLAPGAALDRPLLRLVSFATRRRRDFLGFFAAAILLRRPIFDHQVQLRDALAVDCLPLAGASQRVYVEADGEVLGTLPARLEMTTESVRLLVPAGFRFPRQNA